MVDIITPRNRRRNEFYADVRKDLFPNLVNADVSRRIDEESVKESVKNLVLTETGERLFQPNVGCDIKRMLFENFTTQTKLSMESSIRTTIEQYEPRCQLLSVDARTTESENAVSITIIFNIINIQEPVELVLTLERTR
jgi:phage baseplate assembly protein W